MPFHVSSLDPSLLHAGIGLKAGHCAEILDRRPPLAFFEIHAENYMGDGGPPHRWLSAIAQHYPLSVHGVGLNLGGDEDLEPSHLNALARVVERYEPVLVSEHLAWSGAHGTYLNDLLPIPYTAASLALFCRHVDQVQERLRRPILIENPSAYFAFADTTMSEAEFLSAVVARTGCGLLLDVNNLFVSARNLGGDPLAALDGLPGDAIGEYHLAGHHVRRIGNAEIRIDDHGSAVQDEVWALFAATVSRFGPRPTLIEWDNEIPELSVLLDQAAQANLVTNARISEARHAVAC